MGGGREGSVDSNDSLATHSKPDVWFNVGRRCVLCMFFCAWPGAGVRHACLRSLYVFSTLTYIFLLCVDLERPCVFLNLCTRVNVGSFRTHVHNKMKALSDLFGACVSAAAVWVRASPSDPPVHLEEEWVEQWHDRFQWDCELICSLTAPVIS